MRIQNLLLKIGVAVLVALTVSGVLVRFWKWLCNGEVPWTGGDRPCSRVGFGIVAMGAVVACCILLLRLRKYLPDDERTPPSLVPAVIIMAIGAMLVSAGAIWS